jgi:hypothetical protein
MATDYIGEVQKLEYWSNGEYCEIFASHLSNTPILQYSILSPEAI